MRWKWVRFHYVLNRGIDHVCRCRKENPCKVTILETYASGQAYKSHIASEHFQKYKQGTKHMIKTLVLSDQTPLNPQSQVNNFIQ